MRPIITSGFLLCAILLSAQNGSRSVGSPAEHDENIVITTSHEAYEFSDGPPYTVKTELVREYEATRRAAYVRSSIYYNDNLTLDKATGKTKAMYKNASVDGIFHDDSRICYYDIYLEAKGKNTKTQFKRTYTDPVFFTKIFLAEEFPTKHKTVTIKVPPSISRVEFIDKNFPEGSITRDERIDDNGTRHITYNITNLPALKEDRMRPAPLISEPYILVSGWFASVDDLYAWEHEISKVNNDLPDAETLISDITADATSDIDRIAATFRWVQEHIRYVAYEEGEAGHRPDAPAEVIRKRYGDCKGMALLLATLLCQQGYDAKAASTGTRDIPFKISEVPSLASANHMICVLNNGGKTLFLDATASHTSHEHIPYSIQGKDALVHNGDRFEIINIPVLSPAKSTDSIIYNYILENGALSAKAIRRFTGDTKEHFLQQYHDLPADRRDEFLCRIMIPRSHADVDMNDIRLEDNDPRSTTVTGSIVNNQAVTEADGRLYVDLGTSGDPFTERVDTYKRVNDYVLPYSGVITRTSVLEIPAGYNVTHIPENMTARSVNGEFSCTFTQHDNRIEMTRKLCINNPHIKLADIPEWNSNLTKWDDACNQQIELTGK